MDKTAAAIRRVQWEQIVLEANNSAIPKNAWCKQHGIKEKAFYYWQRKFRTEAAASAESTPAAAVPAPKSAFVELTVLSYVNCQSAVFLPACVSLQSEIV